MEIDFAYPAALRVMTDKELYALDTPDVQVSGLRFTDPEIVVALEKDLIAMESIDKGVLYVVRSRRPGKVAGTDDNVTRCRCVVPSAH
jgi:hypothetical protein